MSSAGQQLVAGRIPGEQIARTELTSDSTTFTTTPIQLASVVAPVVSGRTYWVCYDTAIQSTVAGTGVALQIEEDTLGGAVLQIRHHNIAATSHTATSVTGRGRYTADATENKTFILSGDQQGGTGTLNVNAGPTFPTLFWVEYIEG